MFLKEYQIHSVSVGKKNGISIEIYLHWKKKCTGLVMGFRLPSFLVYDLFKGTRLGFWFGSHLAGSGFVLHSVAGRMELE